MEYAEKRQTRACKANQKLIPTRPFCHIEVRARDLYYDFLYIKAYTISAWKLLNPSRNVLWNSAMF